MADSQTESEPFQESESDYRPSENSDSSESEGMIQLFIIILIINTSYGLGYVFVTNFIWCLSWFDSNGVGVYSVSSHLYLHFFIGDEVIPTQNDDSRSTMAGVSDTTTEDNVAAGTNK